MTGAKELTEGQALQNCKQCHVMGQCYYGLQRKCPSNLLIYTHTHGDAQMLREMQADMQFGDSLDGGMLRHPEVPGVHDGLTWSHDSDLGTAQPPAPDQGAAQLSEPDVGATWLAERDQSPAKSAGSDAGASEPGVPDLGAAWLAERDQEIAQSAVPERQGWSAQGQQDKEGCGGQEGRAEGEGVDQGMWAALEGSNAEAQHGEREGSRREGAVAAMGKGTAGVKAEGAERAGAEGEGAEGEGAEGAEGTESPSGAGSDLEGQAEEADAEVR